VISYGNTSLDNGLADNNKLTQIDAESLGSAAAAPARVSAARRVLWPMTNDWKQEKQAKELIEMQRNSSWMIPLLNDSQKERVG
jgi:hypothetical protein